ncbi:MAG TPA: hypothetical protein VFV96_05110 [Verrucomicrobiae bacterium]|nr:hypothetical protein [Verrucomicrobiae bacterium]
MLILESLLADLPAGQPGGNGPEKRKAGNNQICQRTQLEHHHQQSESPGAVGF